MHGDTVEPRLTGPPLSRTSIIRNLDYPASQNVASIIRNLDYPASQNVAKRGGAPSAHAQ